jgi:hypothetical protein
MFTTKDTKSTKVKNKNIRILRVLRELRGEIGIARCSRNIGPPGKKICASRGNYHR